MCWTCPKCGKETLEVIDSFFKTPSYYYCFSCNKKFDFDAFFEANKNRMATRKEVENGRV